MTQFARKSFSVALGLNEEGRKNYERIFGKARRREAVAAKVKAAGPWPTSMLAVGEHAGPKAGK